MEPTSSVGMRLRRSRKTSVVTYSKKCPRKAVRRKEQNFDDLLKDLPEKPQTEQNSEAAHGRVHVLQSASTQEVVYNPQRPPSLSKETTAEPFLASLSLDKRKQSSCSNSRNRTNKKPMSMESTAIDMATPSILKEIQGKLDKRKVVSFSQKSQTEDGQVNIQQEKTTKTNVVPCDNRGSKVDTASAGSKAFQASCTFERICCNSRKSEEGKEHSISKTTGGPLTSTPNMSKISNSHDEIEISRINLTLAGNNPPMKDTDSVSAKASPNQINNTKRKSSVTKLHEEAREEDHDIVVPEEADIREITPEGTIRPSYSKLQGSKGRRKLSYRLSKLNIEGKGKSQIEQCCLGVERDFFPRKCSIWIRKETRERESRTRMITKDMLSSP